MDGWRRVLLLSLWVCAIGIRAGLSVAQWGPQLATRVEVATPLTSIFGVAEGLFLSASGQSPYAGFALHAPPLLLPLLAGFSDIHSPFTCIPFVVANVLTALLTYHLAFDYCSTPDPKPASGMKRVVSSGWAMYEASFQTKKRSEVEAEPVDAESVAHLCALIYLLNPCTVASCVACTTTNFTSLAVLLALYGGSRQSAPLAALGVVLAGYLSLYTALLALPVGLLVHRGMEPPAGTSLLTSQKRSEAPGPSPLTFLLWLALWTAAILGASARVLEARGSTVGEWAMAQYGFVLMVQDLTPNLGLYWYFFTEVFDYFRAFFLLVLPAQPAALALLLTLRLKPRPLFTCLAVTMLLAIFNPYPSVGDVAVHLALLPMFRPLLCHVRAGLVIVNAHLAVAVLAPVMWHIWIFSGTGNSNFFYAITLVGAGAQTLLLVESTASAIKSDALDKRALQTKPDSPRSPRSPVNRVASS